MDGNVMQVRQRAPRQRRQQDENAQGEKPEDVKEQDAKDCDKVSAIEQSMITLDRTLKKRVKETYRDDKRKLAELHGENIPGDLAKKLKNHGVGIDAIQYLFNPDSFTQTVENIFHFSFLVKKGSASFLVREKGLTVGSLELPPGPVVKYIEENKSPLPDRQAILTLTMQDWRDLCAAYHVTRGDLPYRTGSKHAKRPIQTEDV